MSNKEKCINIINSFSETELEGINIILKSLKDKFDEAEDDAYCLGLYNKYLNSPDKDNFEPLSNVAKRFGVEL